jgi:hypothetical protein
MTDTCADIPGFKCIGCDCEEGINCLEDTCKGVKTFELFFGETLADSGWAIASTQDGGYLITGYFTNSENADANVSLVKIDSSGKQVFLRDNQFGNIDKEYGVDVMELPDQNILILGNKNKGGTDWQLFLIRTDNDGIPIWQKEFGATKLDLGFSMVQRTNNTDLLLYGYTEVYNFADPSWGDEHIVFVSSEGGVAGPRFPFEEPGDDYGSCIELAHDGNYLLLATIDKSPGLGQKLMLYKLDQSLSVLWKKELITSCITKHRGCIRRMPGQNGYLIAGAPVGGDMRLIHVDNNGNGAASSSNYRTITNVGVEKSLSVIILRDGNYVAVSDGMLLVKISADLKSELWRKDLEASTSGVHSILEANDGGLIIVGTKFNAARSSDDIYVVKTNEIGELNTK